MKKKLFIFFIFIIFITIATVLLSAYNLKRETQPDTPLSPTPTIIKVFVSPTQNVASQTGLVFDQKAQEDLEKYQKITKLVEALPYEGINFSLSYDIKKNRFFVHLSEESAKKSFEAYIQNYGVDRKWIEDLLIIDVSPSPAPL